MDQRRLLISDLSARGFADAGRWSRVGDALVLSGDIPDKPGVYCFGVENEAKYLGVATKSLRKRLGFYRTPGATQLTNVRIKTLLLEAAVDSPVTIHVARPDDVEWNGLPVYMAAGLEIGMITRFSLPWNRRGTALSVTMNKQSDDEESQKISEGLRNIAAGLKTIDQLVFDSIRTKPRQTEAEIARFIFGKSGYQQKVNPSCRRLSTAGSIRRLGSGGAGDPFTYIVV